jgi:hypothetical protein
MKKIIVHNLHKNNIIVIEKDLNHHNLIRVTPHLEIATKQIMLLNKKQDLNIYGNLI